MTCNMLSVLNKQAEIDRFEELVILGGPVALPGSLDLLQHVSPTLWDESRIDPVLYDCFQLSSEHPSRWTIVTSGEFHPYGRHGDVGRRIYQPPKPIHLLSHRVLCPSGFGTMRNTPP